MVTALLQVLDLAQMVMIIRQHLKITSFIMLKNYCFNKLAVVRPVFKMNN